MQEFMLVTRGKMEIGIRLRKAGEYFLWRFCFVGDFGFVGNSAILEPLNQLLSPEVFNLILCKKVYYHSVPLFLGLLFSVVSIFYSYLDFGNSVLSDVSIALVLCKVEIEIGP
ncbi:uncharacterized protein LOC133723352 [Rosa rugosa]|uniref:uncharacterized protein LOC133723352 n=1 Tax=Rosa rugosa TaxID=74645 RepID=UPI002B412A7A|nr:uncharacterized protein LOC133723352 [Rosa rugosa]